MAQIAQRRVHPAGNATVAGRRAASVGGYVAHYNNVRLNSAIGYITPKDMLAGRQREIHAERDRKLEAAQNNGRFVASRPRGRTKGQSPGSPSHG
jgi:hypothetical protein